MLSRDIRALLTSSGLPCEYSSVSPPPSFTLGFLFLPRASLTTFIVVKKPNTQLEPHIRPANELALLAPGSPCWLTFYAKTYIRSLKKCSTAFLLRFFDLLASALTKLRPRSVISLACVNKHCFSVIVTISYRTLEFSISDSTQLAEDVQNYSPLLQISNGFGCVHRLIIVNSNLGEAIEEIGSYRTPDHKQPWRRPKLLGFE